MNPTRRHFLRTLLATPLAATLDIEKLLWVPGKQTIFLPSLTSHLTVYEIDSVLKAVYLKRIESIFENDSMFWTVLASDKRNIISSREITVPLRLREDE